MTLTAGAAETVITPPVGTRLEGYGGRHGARAVGVHDDLHARAIAVDDGETRAAIVACDLIAIDRRLSATVRQIVFEATGIPHEHVMVSATHTHAGPPIIGGGDPVLRDTLARGIAAAVIEAHGAMRPAVLKAGRGSVDSVSQNRRHPSLPFDDHLAVLLFDAPDPRDGPIASIVNFACHATVMYRTNMEITADYPGYAAATVKKVLGDAPALFLNGACANVNPAWIEQRFDEAERVGSIVGAEAARRLQELRPLGGPQHVWSTRWDELTEKRVTSGDLIAAPRIRVASRTVDVPMRVLDPPETYDARLAELARQRDALPPNDVEARRRLMEQISMVSGTRGVAEALRPNEAHALHPEIQAISFSPDCAVLGLPGEFFVETAQAIRATERVPQHLMISCYTNHHVMYVVPKEAWAQGGYEPGVSILDDTAEAIFRAAAVDLLREVTRDAS
jgi:hypothetical protein